MAGGLSVSTELAKNGPGLITDTSAPLMAMYRALSEGWIPHPEMNAVMYEAAKNLDDSDPRKAFAGFACSYGGKWFAGRAKASKDRITRNYAAESAKVLIEQIGDLTIRGCEFAALDFMSVNPSSVGMVIYLDPPYAGTTGYKGVGSFDHGAFYSRVEEWSKYEDVFVSEHSMPWGVPLLEFEHSTSVSGKGQKNNVRVERLYHYGPATLRG